MKIFLVLVPIGIERRWGQNLPPLGISSLGAVLLENGHEVFVYDASLDDVIEPTIKQIMKFKPQIVGMSFTTFQVKNAVAIANAIKFFNKDILIIAGGVHVTPLARIFLSHHHAFDIVVKGEGEHTMLELVNTIEKKGQIREVKGIVYRQGNDIIENPPRPLIKDMDSIPFASRMFHSFALDTYSPFDDMPLDYQRNKIRVCMTTSRGCPFDCTFCYCPAMWGASYRKRSPTNVVDEIEYLLREYKVNYIKFYDDNFCLSEEHVLGICKQIKQRGLNFQWRCEARVGPAPLSKRMLQEMKEAGCHMIELGVESGSGRILKSIKKKITTSMIKDAFQLCHKVGMQTKALLISGLPGERMIDTLKTMWILGRIKPDIVNLGACQILPGTAMHRLLIKKGLINEEMWFNYDKVDIPRYYEFVNPFRKYSILIRRKILLYYCRIKGFL